MLRRHATVILYFLLNLFLIASSKNLHAQEKSSINLNFDFFFFFFTTDAFIITELITEENREKGKQLIMTNLQFAVCHMLLISRH